MSTLTNLIVEDRISVIEMNRPDKLNAINKPMEKEILDHLEDLGNDNRCRVIVIRGAGDSFCAGHDLEELAARPARGDGVALHQAQGLKSLTEWFWILRSQPQPIIAQVQGNCVNYGLELAMNCDLVVAADDAKFLSRPLGGMRAYFHLWPWLVGMRRARELAFRRDPVSGREAAEWGMINRSVPSDQLAEATMTLARQIAKTPLDFLALEKQSLNRCSEAMGVLSGILSSVDMASMAHTSETAKTVRRLMKEEGWRKAISFLEEA